jgi:hypothetical protein
MVFTIWIDDAVPGAVPPHQGFRAGDLAGLRILLRLIVEHEFAADQSSAKIDLKLRRVAHVGLHRRLEKADGIPSLRLGAVHREVRVLQQGIHRGAVAGEQRDPQAATCVDAAPVDLERGVEAMVDLLGQHASLGFGIRPDPQLGLDHGEFIAPEPAEIIGRGQNFRDALRHFGEQNIAIVVPERIAHAFKAV